MRLPLFLAGLGLTALMLGAPAHAQLGSVNNPPPQHLFNTDQPRRLDNGLGTMAERRAQLARIRNGQRVRTRHR